jgi:hypothetical protein
MRTWLAIFALAGTLAVASCATGSHPVPVTDPRVPIRATGFVVMPPPGDNWSLIERTSAGVMFGKQTSGDIPGGKRQLRTFVVGVLDVVVGGDLPAHASDFPRFLEDRMRMVENQGGFTVVSVQTSPHGNPSTFCANFRLVLEERNNSNFPGVVFEMTNDGFECLDASKGFIVRAMSSERRPKGEPLIMNESLRAEVDAFLGGVSISPFGSSESAAAEAKVTGSIVPGPTPGSATAVIYIFNLAESSYAKGWGMLALRRALIEVDGKRVAALTDGEYTMIEVTPGPHTVSSKMSIYGLPGITTQSASLDTEAGRRYYVHYYEAQAGMGYLAGVLRQEDASTADEVVRRCKRVPAKAPH